MIDRLISFAMNQRAFVASVFVVMAIVGIWSLCSLPIDSFPDVSNVQVQVITEPESMATEEVESLITIPVEFALNGIPSVHQIRSNSSFGLSVVTAIFDEGTDIWWARQLVNQRLQQMDLPEDTPKPYLGPVVSSFSQVFGYYLTSDHHSLTDLRTIQDWYVARRLRNVPGVANVVSYGGFVKQYQVLVSPAKLRSYGLHLATVESALRQNNANAGGNFIEQAGQEVIIRGIARIEGVDDIKNIVLSSQNGTAVKIGQVADVQIGPAFRRGSASINGVGEAVTGMVMTRRGVNTKETVDRVQQRILAIQKELPEGVKLHVFYDQTQLVEKTIDTVKEILLISGGLVIIVLAAILLDIPTALIVSIVIPLSLLFSFILMKFTGLSANLMTLGAVDFGVIVDAGVVMAENIYRQLALASHEGRRFNRREVITRAAKEVGKPIAFAIFIIISVYLPLFTLEGVEGKMFHPLALTFMYALFGGLLVSLTLVPVMCSWVLKGKIVERENVVLNKINALYKPALAAAMERPWKIASTAMVGLICTLCILPFIGSEFIPSLDEGSIVVRVRFDPSVAHTESMRVCGVAERMLKSFPESDVVVTRIGRSGMGGDLEGVDNADIYVGLKPKSQWTTAHNKEALVQKMAQKMRAIPGLAFSFSQPIADMVDDIVSGVRADLAIKVFGDDLHVIDQLTSQIMGITEKIPGAGDVSREIILGLPQMNIKVKRDVIARYGLNAEDIHDILETAVAGRVVTEVVEGTKRFGVLVRFPLEDRGSPEAIQNILVETPQDGSVPLKALADIQMSSGTVMVNREDGDRRAAVLINVRGRDLGSFATECQRQVESKVKLPKGYRIVWGGQFENQQRAMQRLAIVVPIVLLIIFFLLFVSFGSLKNAALVMLNVPFSMIGGILALALSRQVLSVPALIGFIALFGVAVQNGVILVSYALQLQKKGMPVASAAVEGAYIRLRPVLMTAFVATVGLLPKVFSDGTGAEVQRPLATVVLGGLVSATLLTLLVLPTMFAAINRTAPKPTPPGDQVPDSLPSVPVEPAKESQTP
jgi:cobalt-zinc-cadmium resistance protein CzcA